MSMLYFRHTYDLENFHSMKLSYLPKRTSFGFATMEIRTLIAALDHNFHLHQEYLQHFGDGENLFLLQRHFNKHSAEESAAAIRAPKDYAYQPCVPLLAMFYASHPESVPRELRHATFDPRDLAPTIRGKRSKPTDQLQLEHILRFCKRASKMI